MKYMYEVTDIEWDADADFEAGGESLPTEIRFMSDRIMFENEVSDRITEETGVLNKGFRFKRTVMPICGNCRFYKNGRCSKMKMAVDELSMSVCFKERKEVA